ncbi:MAG: hypothetical protein JXR97_00385 [Planctomycetes bacterium]|nr:hypothetical protein [Planctomycetota bacterium]
MVKLANAEMFRYDVSKDTQQKLVGKVLCFLLLCPFVFFLFYAASQNLATRSILTAMALLVLSVLILWLLFIHGSFGPPFNMYKLYIDSTGIGWTAKGKDYHIPFVMISLVKVDNSGELPQVSITCDESGEATYIPEVCLGKLDEFVLVLCRASANIDIEYTGPSYGENSTNSVRERISKYRISRATTT